MKNLITKINFAIFALAATLLTACSRDAQTGVLAPLADVYIEMTHNYAALAESYKTAEATTDPAERERLADEIRVKNRQYEADRQALIEKANAIGEKLAGTPFEVVAAPATGIEVSDGVIAEVSGRGFSNVIIKAKTAQPLPASARCLLIDNAGEVIGDHAVLAIGEGLSVTLHLTSVSSASKIDRNIAYLESISRLAKIQIVVDQPANEAAEADETEADEAEPTVGDGGEQAAADGFVANGIEVKVGAPMVETLRKLGKLTFDFNADYGVTCNVGNRTIVIDTDDLNERGIEVINAITSDMENGINFSIDYIKPSATIKEIL